MEQSPELRAITQALLHAPRVVEDLAVLNQFILAAAANPHIQLDETVSWLNPAAEAFADSKQAYYNWVSRLTAERSRLAYTEDKPELRRLRRNIYQRIFMEVRRARLRLGLRLVEEKLGRELTPSESTDYERRLMASWKRQRDQHVAARAARPSYDEKLVLQNEFWEELDDRLKRAVAQLDDKQTC